jgi:prevent-host-death family protein
MQTVTAMEFRRHLGAYLDEVRLKSESIILERAGKPVAMLTPVGGGSADSSAASRRLRAVRDLAGIHRGSERSNDIDGWLKRERDNWQ